MDYEEAVSRKLAEVSIRPESLQALWMDICAAYRNGGEDRVRSTLEKQVRGQSDAVHALLEELRMQL